MGTGLYDKVVRYFTVLLIHTVLPHPDKYFSFMNQASDVIITLELPLDSCYCHAFNEVLPCKQI